MRHQQPSAKGGGIGCSPLHELKQASAADGCGHGIGEAVARVNEAQQDVVVEKDLKPFAAPYQ